MRALLLALLSLTTTLAFSQEDPEQIPFELSRREAAVGSRLYGKVVDSKSNKGLEAASVQVFVKVKDSTGGTRDSLVAGNLTRPNGEFNFINAILTDTFKVVFTAIGYREISENFVLGRGGNQSPGFERDLGNIKLAEEADFLGAVTITATKPPLTLSVDRKVFNVDKSLTSTGGTAIDVMRNIPTLTVDVEGNVQLRNTTPQIFVDGRPTILTLDQIPADDIERVELITNPSAKFDAASSGGIVNVILKKNRRGGLNGIVSGGLGTPGIRNGSLTLNLRQGKFNFFTNGNYNRSGGIGKGESFRQNKENGIPSDYFNQVSSSERIREFTSARFGIDYFINNRNTISITQGFVKGNFDNFEDQDQEYRNVFGELDGTGQRFSDGTSTFNRSNSQLLYKHNFPKSGHELTADLTFNKGSRTSSTLITNYFQYYDNGRTDDTTTVRNDGTNDNSQLTFQVDYANPISENSKIEMGLRSFLNDQTSILNVFSLIGNVESKLPLSNNYKFEEQIHAAYLTYTGVMGKIKYQAGLRGEYSKFTGTLIDSAQSFGYTLPEDIGSIWDGLFPSLYLSRPINDETEVQLNFSRRIRRPNFWQLNPYVDINDPLNISVGNPTIRPEYVNSFEFNFSKRYSVGSFLTSLYYRNNQGDITRYSDTLTAEQFEQLNNAGVDPNAIVNTFINAQYTNRMGAEFTLQHKIGENLELIPSLNLQYRVVKAEVGDLILNNQGFNWETKLITNYKIPSQTLLFKNVNLQLTAEYESREIIPQGYNREQYVIDFAFRKEFLKNNAATITFAVNDVLNGNRWGQIYDTENFYQDSYRRWNVRNFRVTFSYRFGKRDFALGRQGGRDRQGGGGDDD